MTKKPMAATTKPILKWVGGKTQILSTVLNSFPPGPLQNYHEPFVGGGSVLLGMLSSPNIRNRFCGNIYAYDINAPLIGMYLNIQSKPEELYTQLQEIITEFTAHSNPDDREAFYYIQRSQYNDLSESEKCSVLGSALFIFLNKTCFRGIFRVGPNGFNVPYGHYKNPEIINKDHLMQVHKLIQPVKFICSDFSESLKRVKSGDFVYLDPPYAPETNRSFDKYTNNGFRLEKHYLLFKAIKTIGLCGAKYLLSNANVSLVRESFQDNKNSTEEIKCRRAIHSKAPGTTTTEVLIRNY